MKFRKPDQLILFGGSRSLCDFAIFAAKRLPYSVGVFSAKRHLNEKVPGYERPLRQILRRQKIEFFESEDINREPRLYKIINRNTLGIAFGAAWVFEKPLVKKFAPGHLLDLMGIDLPRYRGGAHYTWQILHGNRKGSVNLQIIEGGKETFHRGRIVKRAGYEIPPSARRPIDYFDFLSRKEADFLREFFREVAAGKNFALQKLDERQSSYYPFLSTPEQGWINWSWSGEEVARFINAFSHPYTGASTLLRGKQVRIFECEVLAPEENYHPFTAGLIVRKDKKGVYVAARGALLKISNVKGEAGDRFYTPAEKLGAAMTFNAIYDHAGLTATN